MMEKGGIGTTFVSIFVIIMLLGFIIGADDYEAGDGKDKAYLAAFRANCTERGMNYLATQNNDDERMLTLRNKTVGFMFMITPDLMEWGYDAGYDSHIPAVPAAIILLFLVMVFTGGFKLVLIPVVLVYDYIKERWKK